MFGLLGLMGALFAGFVVDALSSTGHDSAPDHTDASTHDLHHHEARTADASGSTTAETGSMLDDPGAANDPTAGLPVSHDGATPPDPPETLHGGSANDILTGEGGNDVVAGGSGNDLLGGRNGDDLIEGGQGTDWMHGGAGADTLGGAKGGDDLQGEAGNDSVAGGVGNDALYGGTGHDHLAGGHGADSLVGGSQADTVQGGSQDDAVQGGSGGDHVSGGKGSDTVDGNDGNDTIWGDSEGHADEQTDFLNGGSGNDVIHADAGDYANGGTGADQFALSEIKAGDPVVQITDFNQKEDSLVLLYDPIHHADPSVSVQCADGSPDATVLLDGIPVAHVLGGAGLQAGDVQLRSA